MSTPITLEQACETAVDRLADHLSGLGPEARFAEMLRLTTADDPAFYDGPDAASLATMDAVRLAQALRETAYPFAGDRPLALTHAHERRLIDDIHDHAFRLLRCD